MKRTFVPTSCKDCKPTFTPEEEEAFERMLEYIQPPEVHWLRRFLGMEPEASEKPSGEPTLPSQDNCQ